MVARSVPSEKNNMCLFKKQCKFNTGITCPIQYGIRRNKERTCCFNTIPTATNEKIAQFIYCYFNGRYVYADEAINKDKHSIFSEKEWCCFRENTDICSVFACEVLRCFLNINTSGNNITNFDFQTSTGSDLTLQRICNNADLLTIKSGSLLFLINKQQFIDDPLNSDINIKGMLRGKVFREKKINAAHVLFYLGHINNNLYIGGMNHTSLYSNGVVPVSLFFHFETDFVWTLNNRELYALFAWEVR